MPKLAAKLSRADSFDFEALWRDFFYEPIERRVREDFQALRETNPGSLINRFEEYLNKIFYTVDKYGAQLIEVILAANLYVLPKHGDSLQNFIDSKLKDNDLVVFYFGNPLFDEDKFLDIFNIISSFARFVINANENKPLGVSNKKTLGVLVEYSLHKYLAKSKPFYNKCFNFENVSSTTPLSPNPFDFDRNLVELRSRFRMAFNEIDDLPMIGIEELDLSDNLIINLNEFSFSQNEFMSLLSLQLNSNMIKFIDERTFVSQKNLTKLNLSQNIISEIKEEWFSSLVNLTDLNLSNNLIKKIPKGVLKNLHKLKRLDLSSNCVLILESFFDMERNDYELEELRLEFNKISFVPFFFFKNMKKLKYAFLHSNKIIYLENNLFHGINPVLELLTIFSNPIKSIARNALKPLSRVKVLLIYDTLMSPNFDFRSLLETKRFCEHIDRYDSKTIEKCLNRLGSLLSYRTVLEFKTR
jgi:hypothetical protein